MPRSVRLRQPKVTLWKENRSDSCKTACRNDGAVGYRARDCVSSSRGAAAIDFQAFPIWLNVAIFGIAAIFVWIAGTRLAWYAGLYHLP
jgi:hypothetical protein